MKTSLSFILTLFAAISLQAAPLSESDAVLKVKELSEFTEYAKKASKYAFDDNEFIKDFMGAPTWRIDVRTIVSDPTATHLTLWNRFYVNASDGSIMVWNRLKADGSVLSLKEWRAQQAASKAEQGAAANP